MKIKSMSHVGLTVSNFEKAVTWYGEKFGFSLIDVKEMNAKQIEALPKLYGLKDTRVKFGFLRAPGGGVLEIFQFTPTAEIEDVRWNRPGPTHFTLDVKNVPKWYEKLKAQGVEFCSEPQYTGGAYWVFMRDPDGNLIELIDLKILRFIIQSPLGSLLAKVFRGGKYKSYYK